MIINMHLNGGSDPEKNIPLHLGFQAIYLKLHNKLAEGHQTIRNIGLTAKEAA